MKTTLKKVLDHYTRFYMRKYIDKNINLYATTTYLNIQTKLFGKVDDTAKRNYKKLALDTIREICLKGPENIRQLARTTVLSESNRNVNSTQTQTPRRREERKGLQITDIQQNISRNKTQAKKKGLDLEIHNYDAEPSKIIEPNIYWSQSAETYPCLFYCFKQLFAIPASNVPAERLFSHAGYNVWDRRSKIAPEKINKVMVVYENL
jgi:hypothetical protein